jgi:hypothetical protein
MAHALSGMAIFAGAESVLKTTPLYLLGSLVHNPTIAASILIATAVLAIIPHLTREPRRSWFMLLILPQQCLLLMHFVSAVLAIMAGQYHDGYVPSGGSAFIFADQIWLDGGDRSYTRIYRGIIESAKIAKLAKNPTSTYLSPRVPRVSENGQRREGRVAHSRR